MIVLFILHCLFLLINSKCTPIINEIYFADANDAHDFIEITADCDNNDNERYDLKNHGIVILSASDHSDLELIFIASIPEDNTGDKTSKVGNDVFWTLASSGNDATLGLNNLHHVGYAGRILNQLSQFSFAESI